MPLTDRVGFAEDAARVEAGVAHDALDTAATYVDAHCQIARRLGGRGRR